MVYLPFQLFPAVLLLFQLLLVLLLGLLLHEVHLPPQSDIPLTVYRVPW